MLRCRSSHLKDCRLNQEAFFTDWSNHLWTINLDLRIWSVLFSNIANKVSNQNNSKKSSRNSIRALPSQILIGSLINLMTIKMGLFSTMPWKIHSKTLHRRITQSRYLIGSVKLKSKLKRMLKSLMFWSISKIYWLALSTIDKYWEHLVRNKMDISLSKILISYLSTSVMTMKQKGRK